MGHMARFNYHKVIAILFFRLLQLSIHPTPPSSPPPTQPLKLCASLPRSHPFMLSPSHPQGHTPLRSLLPIHIPFQGNDVGSSRDPLGNLHSEVIGLRPEHNGEDRTINQFSNSTPFPSLPSLSSLLSFPPLSSPYPVLVKKHWVRWLGREAQRCLA